MSPDDNLKAKARFLHNAAPQQYADFTAAFADYAAHVADFMVMTTDDLTFHQGRARQCRKIRDILEEAKNGK